MRKFTTLTGIAAPMPMINVDTDMIIPKQYLKTIKRTGLGKGLFAEARYDADDKVLGAAVGGTAREAGLARRRRDVHQVAAVALQHLRKDGLHPVEDAVDVDVDLALGDLVRLLEEEPDGHDPGVVDQGVDGADLLLDLG